MKTRSLYLCLLCLVLALVMMCSATAETYEASTMRLLRYEGDVEIFDTAGNSRFVLENVRFASGEALKTGVASMASVSLDDSKILTLDASSQVRFDVEGGHTVLTLTEGTIFLDVQEKLDENESLDIQTTTMTVGIRGTILFVSVLPASTAMPLYKQEAESADSESVTVFGVLEGSAKITEASGRTAEVNAGQLIVVEEAIAENEPIEMKMENLTPFIKQQLEDEKVANRVEIACPQLFDEYDYPADGDWEYTGKVMIIAQSASKLYDGNPLTRTGDILVYGLPEFFDISAHAGGSRTDAGESENPIVSYTITNAKGENVTDHFKDIETVSGNLVVDPAPMTIWTGSATKSYDGTPLTNEEAGFDLVSGSRHEEPWRNTSLVLSETDGETLYGISGTILVHGTNPLTGETCEIMLNTGERLTVHLSDEARQESIDFKVEKISEEDLPEDVLRLYADNPELLTTACKDADWDEEKIRARIAELPPQTTSTTVKDGLTVSAANAGGLMRQLTNARINIDSDITDYNGRALSGEEARFAEVRIDDSVTVTATGSRTEVGESENTYEIDWGSENRANFIVTEDIGTLRVLPQLNDATITAGSVSKVYDGKPLKADYTVATGFPDGYTVIATTRGSLTNAGTEWNKVESFQILDENGEDVTEYYPDIRTQSGKLTVTPAELTITTGSAEKQYDGTALTSEETGVTGLVNGETITVTATGTITDAGTTENTCAITWDNAKSTNYTVTESRGTLAVTPAPLTIRTGSANKMYDGKPLTNGDVTVTGLKGSDTATVTPKGTITLVGSADNTYDIDWGSTNPGNYTLTEELGTLTVTQNTAKVVFTADSASKDYDGTVLTAEEVSVSGLPKGVFRGIGTAGGSQTNVGSSANPVAVYSIVDGDGNDVTACFSSITTKDGTLEVDPCSFQIVLGGKFAYDGEMHYANLSVSGLPANQYSVSMNSDGSGQITFAWGDVMRVQVNYGGIEAGFYNGGNNPLTASFDAGDRSNYAYSVKANTVQITEGTDLGD